MKTIVSSSAVAYSSAIENVIGVYKTCVESMAKDSRITPSATENEINAARIDLEDKYCFSNVLIATDDGSTIDKKENVSEYEYFKEALEGKTYISSPVIKKRMIPSFYILQQKSITEQVIAE